MDVKEKIRVLEQLRWLRREVDDLSQRIAELELAARGGSGRVTGLPRSWRAGDRVGDYAAKLADMATLLDRRRARCMALLGALYGFIDDIGDSLLRQIMTFRYVDGESWQRIAGLIGETDEQFPRRLHNRFLQEHEIPFSGKFDENDESDVL